VREGDLGEFNDWENVDGQKALHRIVRPNGPAQRPTNHCAGGGDKAGTAVGSSANEAKFAESRETTEERHALECARCAD
jgi:hypothetical protein